jgi:hypothetical protein
LGKNKIDDEGAKYIASALQDNVSLNTLTLDRNDIGDQGAKYIIALIDRNPVIQNIDMEFNCTSMLKMIKEKLARN